MGKVRKVIVLSLSLIILSLSLDLSDAVSNTEKTIFSIEIPQPSVRNESGILYYNIRGFHSTITPDMPKLPFRTYFFEIPFNAENITVRLKADSVSMGSVRNIGISKPVIISIADKKVQITNSKTETKTATFPKSIYSIDGIRQIGRHKILAISIYPMQYDFSIKELKFYKNISIEINYDKIFNFDYSNAEGSLLKEKIAEQIVYNYNSNITNENSSGIKYVIITTPEIAPALEPLRDWKTKKGVPARIYTTDWIYEKYNGTPNYVFHSGTGNDLNNSMKTIIDLRNVSHANLSFLTMFNIEYGWDFGYVEASVDGLNWKQLNGTFMTSYRDNKAYVGIPGVMAYTGNRSWVHDTISLDSYAGNITHLRFRYITDTYVSHGGWFIKNITINNNTPNWEFSGFEIVDINSGFNTAQNLIRNFIKDMVNNGTEWVLLAGDDSKIPAMRVQRTWYQELEDNDVVPTDYYYGNLEGNWNTDNDEIYGENDDTDEITDWLPDVYVGRLPASSIEDMEILVNKTLKYEKNPEMKAKWFNRAVLAAGESDELTDEGYLKDLIKNNFLNGFNITRLYYLDNYEHEYPLDYSDIENQLSIGQSIVNLAGHGSYSSIAKCLTCSVFIDTNTNPANGDMLPLVYADSCNTGAFDQDNNLGKTAIMNWAIGFIGSTRTSYYAQEWQPGAGVNQEMDYRFWEQFSNGSYRPGEALFKSKAWYVLYQLENDEYPDAAKKNLLDYNLLGDPEIPIWTDMPRNFTVNWTEKIYTGRQNLTIIVKNSTGQAVDNAVVAIQKGSEIYEYKKTNSEGRVEFNINTPTKGKLDITVTKHNFLPFEGNISVISNEIAIFLLRNISTCIVGDNCTGQCITVKGGNDTSYMKFEDNNNFKALKPSDPDINNYEQKVCLNPILNNFEIEDLKNEINQFISMTYQWSNGSISLSPRFIEISSEIEMTKWGDGLYTAPWNLRDLIIEDITRNTDFVIVSNDMYDDTLDIIIPLPACGGTFGADYGIGGGGYSWIPKTHPGYWFECANNDTYIHEWYHQLDFVLEHVMGIEDIYKDNFTKELCGNADSNPYKWFPSPDTAARDPDFPACRDYYDNWSGYCESIKPRDCNAEWNKHLLSVHYDPAINLIGNYCRNGKKDFSETGIDCSGECKPCKCKVMGDKDCNSIVDDFELLDYINLWTKNLVSDFDLLEAINNWAKS